MHIPIRRGTERPSKLNKNTLGYYFYLTQYKKMKNKSCNAQECENLKWMSECNIIKEKNGQLNRTLAFHRINQLVCGNYQESNSDARRRQRMKD